MFAISSAVISVAAFEYCRIVAIAAAVMQKSRRFIADHASYLREANQLHDYMSLINDKWEPIDDLSAIASQVS
jgi:hypothetical protein